MTNNDIEVLLRGGIRELIERNIDADHLRAALSLGEYSAIVATQIKYLQRARVKLPTYYAYRCIIPPLAFEQSSSEVVAICKDYAGKFCIDLTCGLGVDSLALSKRFERMISCEQNEILAEVTKRNFEMMGVQNIEVRCCTAEILLRDLISDDAIVDLVYVDPARRSESGSKIFLLEDCSPNVVDMLPKISRVARKLVVKCSPLFDVTETFRKFRLMMPSADKQIMAEVVSLGGECKEVVIEIDFTQSNRRNIIRATAIGSAEVGTMKFECEYNGEKVSDMVENISQFGTKSEGKLQFNKAFKYMLVPDVSLYKARLMEQYFAYKSVHVYVSSATGYCFADDIPPNFMGKYYQIDSVEPYKPKELKKYLKQNTISKITIMKKDFPFSADQIASALGVKQGDEQTFVFTTINNIKYVIRLKKDRKE